MKKKIALLMLNEMAQKEMIQKELALKMQCSQQYVSKILKGKENLSLETLAKIECTLNIKVLEFNSSSF